MESGGISLRILVLLLYGSERLASCFCTQGKVPGTHWVGRWVGTDLACTRMMEGCQTQLFMNKKLFSFVNVDHVSTSC